MTDERAKLVDDLRYRGALDRLMGGTMYQAADQIEADGALLKEAYALLAQWHCELRMTAQHVTRAKVSDWLDRAKGELK